MQNVNYRLFIYMLPIPIIIFYTLSLTGCISVSPGIPNIFTLKLADNLGHEIRVGYFAMCVSTSNGLNCQPTSGKNTEGIIKVLTPTTITPNETTDKLEKIVSLALELQSKYILGLLAGAGLLFAISLLFISLLKRDFKMPANNLSASKRRDLLRRALMSTTWTSIAFALASAISFDQTTNAVAFVSQVNQSANSIHIVGGKTLSVLQWLALGCSVLFGIGISSIFAKEGGTIHSTGSIKVGFNVNDSHSALPATSLPPPPPPPPPPAAW